jgi:hypothetical protein
MLRYGMKYVDQGAKFYEARHRERQIGQLKWKAAKLGFHVVEAADFTPIGVSGETPVLAHT